MIFEELSVIPEAGHGHGKLHLHGVSTNMRKPNIKL